VLSKPPRLPAPAPNWPQVLRPQAQTVPSAFSARV